ncbi:diguanylate cyclase (GGDEF)-like protein/PAS domain S-box-containing protein [Herbaspirillum sp. Sphag1AN]|uniref:EAL domain-containing protein n=1 Tax=unclassified Herbaspirillum TaxID=2624150 RepID=UPI00161F3BE4|nr:diguanylate cyclase (GGDEF)-like protein/PAS domain S-box-containing protein [Herbaspirillum sp. Sphag1AN]MBB3246485.1 diguanylate cyclase (GGDEF)-like protein/PAS domain S-box-containing protein [Herbaspirillum sp. Sphag64]
MASSQAKYLVIMTFLSTLIRRYRPRSSLSLGLIVAVAAGMMLPVLIGLTLLVQLRDRQVDADLKTELRGRMSLLADSLVSPIWNVDTQKIAELSDTVMLDPRVVRITITDPAQQIILNVEHAERRQGKSHSFSHQLLLPKAVPGTQSLLGTVELELDDGLIQHELSHDLQSYIVILFGQFVISLGLVSIALHFRVLNPLARLTRFSRQLARGNFERAIDWERTDEIGLLASQMDNMRNALKIAFHEQRAILDNVQVGVVFARDNIIRMANREAEKIFGAEPQALLDQSLFNVFQKDDRSRTEQEQLLGNNTLADYQYEETLLLRRFDHSVFWAYLRCSNLDPTHPEGGNIWVIEDISDRKAAEEEINKLAFYDSLTQLPNRRLLLDRLNRALISSYNNGKKGALLFIDLDEFKTLNDTLGHDVGDLLLREVAGRLSSCVRDSDTVARLGGDEFVVMLEALSDNRDEAVKRAEMLGREIFQAFDLPFVLDGHEVRSTPSIGVTLFDGRHNHLEELLKQADLAMYQSKAAGRNTLCFFDVAMQALVSERAALEIALREAIRCRQFVLYFQPQIMGKDRVIGAEVLVRWQHPERGIVSPAEFITLAEETGLIVPLGNWVLEAACMQLVQWAKQSERSHLSLAVNISARQINQNDFVTHVLAILKRTGVNPNLLKLELTESVLLTNIESTIKKMVTLKAVGLGFSLDDFGTGFSSLTYLKRLPLEQLKIDQCFVREVLISPNDAAIAKMIIALAATLGLVVVAEGVEIQGQFDFLSREGCHTYQGYYFSRPLPLADFEDYVNRYAG